jgi:hypothetical protein
MHKPTGIETAAESPFHISGESVELPLDLARTIHKVAEAAANDPDILSYASTEFDKHERHATDGLATLLPASCYGSAAEERGEVAIPISHLTIAYRAATAVIESNAARKDELLERFGVAAEPKTFAQKCRKLGSEAVSTVMVATGRFSKSGRNARKLKQSISQEELKKLQEASDRNRLRRKQTPVAFGMDEFSFGYATEPGSIPAGDEGRSVQSTDPWAIRDELS